MGLKNINRYFEEDHGRRVHSLGDTLGSTMVETEFNRLCTPCNRVSANS